MNLIFSKLGSGLAGGSGIGELMDDLGHALANAGPDLKMLGGGQPAQIPAVNAIWRERLAEITADPAAANRFLTTYDPPQGNPAFIAAIADLMRDTFGWEISPENVGLTCGGQTAFFHLFNLLAGEMPDGSHRKILFPLVPEYIGYAAQGLDPGMFLAMRPEIETTGPHEFKYHIDFDHLPIGPDIAAICVSRPTNPTGNVLSDGEMARLSALAREHGIPSSSITPTAPPSPASFLPTRSRSGTSTSFSPSVSPSSACPAPALASSSARRKSSARSLP